MSLRLVILSLLVSSVVLVNHPVDNEDTQLFTMPDNRRAQKFNIIAVPNKELVIKIRANLTTGYNWFVDNISEIDSMQIIIPHNLNDDFDTSDYFVDEHERGEVGVGGYLYFKFKPLKEGETKIIFVNKRHWDPSDQVKVETTITIAKPQQTK